MTRNCCWLSGVTHSTCSSGNSGEPRRFTADTLGILLDGAAKVGLEKKGCIGLHRDRRVESKSERGG